MSGLDEKGLTDALAAFNGGIVREASNVNPRGFIDFYRPMVAMQAAIRAYLVATPPDVARLVVAARLVLDVGHNGDEFRDLDKAVEAFSSRVRYEDDPDDDLSSNELINAVRRAVAEVDVLPTALGGKVSSPLTSPKEGKDALVEPVAWQFRFMQESGDWGDWNDGRCTEWIKAKGWEFEERGLYTRPAPLSPRPPLRGTIPNYPEYDNARMK